MATRLATLRPTGDLGDQSDSTFIWGQGAAGAFYLPGTRSAFSAWNGLGTVESVRFGFRYKWSQAEAGAQVPIVSPIWRLGNSDPEESVAVDVTAASSAITDFSTVDQALAPGGVAWTAANINTLQLRLLVVLDDVGLQLVTDNYVYELWVEVWGQGIGGTPSTPLSADRTAIGPLSTGNLFAELKSGTTCIPGNIDATSPRLRSGRIVARRQA